MKFSQLRQDAVSGDWIVIAPQRVKRPHAPLGSARRRRESREQCIFEDPERSSGEKAVLTYGAGDRWTLKIVRNKFPAFRHRGVCAVPVRRGPYTVTEGVGHHEIAVTRNHNRDFPDLSDNLAVQVFQAFRDRYLMLMNDECLAYISLFHNWGPSAGASIYHPHYQIIAVPVVPPDIEHSLEGSLRYFRREKRCVHCAIIQWERREKKRIIYENTGAIAIAPFASRVPYEMRIFPKVHLPYFENSFDHHLEYAVDALRVSLRLMRTALRNPDYNFFLHTAPILRKERYQSYHWHIEVLPKVNIAAGFELGTGLEINPVDPSDAAKILRSKKS